MRMRERMIEWPESTVRQGESEERERFRETERVRRLKRGKKTKIRGHREYAM